MKAARLLLILLAPFILVSAASAGTRVVDTDGTVYSVGVAALTDGSDPEATGIRYEILRPNGTRSAGWVAPTSDFNPDAEPVLFQELSTSTPVLIWTRQDGRALQVAWARYTASGWSEMKLLTSGPGDHRHPAAGVDAQGTGYIVWVDPAGAGSVMLATFDPVTGNLLSSPRDLFRALVRASPPVWLTARTLPPLPGGAPANEYPGGILPEGGNDAPAIPPNNQNKIEEPVNGEITIGPTCTQVAAAVVRHRALAIGILEGGAVVRYYRAVIPVGAPPDYVELLLRSLRDQSCQ